MLEKYWYQSGIQAAEANVKSKLDISHCFEALILLNGVLNFSALT